MAVILAIVGAMPKGNEVRSLRQQREKVQAGTPSGASPIVLPKAWRKFDRGRADHREEKELRKKGSVWNGTGLRAWFGVDRVKPNLARSVVGTVR
jgi:hypothetical protein